MRMRELTTEQIARANNFAIAMGAHPREIIEALQQILNVGTTLGVPVDETEELFFLVGETLDA
jgi:hypothetical protein